MQVRQRSGRAHRDADALAPIEQPGAAAGGDAPADAGGGARAARRIQIRSGPEGARGVFSWKVGVPILDFSYFTKQVSDCRASGGLKGW